MPTLYAVTPFNASTKWRNCKMSTTGYIRIPRSLLQDPMFIDLPSKYKEIFFAILDRVVFKPTKFSDHGHLITLEPGQLCASIREIAQWCNKKIGKNEIERSIKQLFARGFLRQEVRHKKSIITITHLDTYNLILNESETKSETNLRQTRDKLETQKKNVKNVKKEKKNDIISPDSFFSERAKGVFISEADHEWLVSEHDVGFAQSCYNKLSEWKATAKTEKQNQFSDIGRIKKWVITAVRKDRVELAELEQRENRLIKFAQPKQEDAAQHKKIAEKFESDWKSPHANISACSTYLEIATVGAVPRVFQFEYGKPTFQIEVEQCLKANKFAKLENEVLEPKVIAIGSMV